jgi:XTP/dITP diphosphohydrolase
MGRKLGPGRLLLASHNEGKLKEINELARAHGIVIESAAERRLKAPEESENSFAGNALLKARAAANASGLPALGDDSGLEARALDGAPGIFSARWAGPKQDFAAAMARVERELKSRGASDYSARFVCALALAWPDGHAETFEGDVCGRLVFPPRGTRGFGYDPIFMPNGCTRTFGEMAAAEKHALSHRARALAALAAACF